MYRNIQISVFSRAKIGGERVPPYVEIQIPRLNNLESSLIVYEKPRGRKVNIVID